MKGEREDTGKKQVFHKKKNVAQFTELNFPSPSIAIKLSFRKGRNPKGNE